MRVVVYDGDVVVYQFDNADRAATSFPANIGARPHLIHTLTEALRYLLMRRPGALDNEV